MDEKSAEHRSIWYDANADEIKIIDQTCLPHSVEILSLDTLDQACNAISLMQVRGAPLIGITAVFGLYLALRDEPQQLEHAVDKLLATRPTAVNLAWALNRASQSIASVEIKQRAVAALQLAQQMAAEDVAACAAIGDHGAAVLQNLWQQKADKNAVLNVLTHCNAGALATVDWGTALAVVYKARDRGVPLHVWVDETRPRNQGASLTCWELGQRGVDHSLIVDNAGGHLMQNGQVDVCIVGSDRTTASGDVCNKIGTYLKALAAFDNEIPFYAAMPVSTIDFTINDGITEIPIEERSAEEVTHISGLDAEGIVHTVRIAPATVVSANFGFDVTPARFVTGIITEHGVFPASVEGLAALA